MGIWGLRPPLLPRPVPGFFSLWRPLAFSKTLSSAWLGSWIQVYLGCLAACSPSRAEMHLQSCWTAQESLPAAPWPGAEPSAPQELPTTSTLTRASGDTSPAPKLLSKLCPASPNPTAVPSRAQLCLSQATKATKFTSLSIYPSWTLGCLTPNTLSPHHL